MYALHSDFYSAVPQCYEKNFSQNHEEKIYFQKLKFCVKENENQEQMKFNLFKYDRTISENRTKNDKMMQKNENVAPPNSGRYSIYNSTLTYHNLG